MAGTTLQQDLNNFVRSLREQGILDHYFDYVTQMQDNDNPVFVSEVINVFMRDADSAMAQIHISLLEPSVDYNKLISAAHQLRGASSSIGGCHVALACRELRYACDDRDKERCVATFQKVVDEYRTLRTNLGHIMNLESQVRLASERTQSRRPRN